MASEQDVSTHRTLHSTMTTHMLSSAREQLLNQVNICSTNGSQQNDLKLHAMCSQAIMDLNYKSITYMKILNMETNQNKFRNQSINIREKFKRFQIKLYLYNRSTNQKSKSTYGRILGYFKTYVNEVLSSIYKIFYFDYFKCVYVN